MPTFEKEQLPPGTSWIQNLNSLEAIEQCRILGVTPERTLEQNRRALREYIQGLPTPTASAPVTQAQDTPSSAHAPIDAFSLQNVEDFLRGNQGQEQSSSSNRWLPAPLPYPPMVQPPPMRMSDELLQQMRQLNTEAIAQVTVALAPKESPKPSQPEDTSIPHFVREMLKDLPRVDGSNTPDIIKFLKSVTKMLEFKFVAPKAILLNLTSHTADTFRDFWVEQVSNLVTWDHLLGQFREGFLTSEKLRAIQNNTLYRTQNQSEKLADYVKDMQLSYQILSPETTPDKVFEIVFCRINPETRNSLTGCYPLDTLQHLIAASRVAENIREHMPQAINQTQERQPQTPDRQPQFPRQFNAGQGPRNFHNPNTHHPQRNPYARRHNNMPQRQNNYNNYNQQQAGHQQPHFNNYQPHYKPQQHFYQPQEHFQHMVPPFPYAPQQSPNIHVPPPPLPPPMSAQNQSNNQSLNPRARRF